METTTSPYIIVKSSSIHNKGIFAKTDIPKDAQILEYVGEKITKKEAERRADLVLNASKNDKTMGAVYLFELNKRYDIDGNVPYNTAKYINHSCKPNCDADIYKGKIWVTALRDIKAGEELGYNYGYDLEEFRDHPCKCGSENCVGYIVREEDWGKLKELLKEEMPKKDGSG
ncbi:SET domain-containing protein-lysine N-methyltransferase [Candidatus Woesearchaeota archaeon CG10_big_fil_rev_8_21_14_0_10_45_16]|nr:MAG: SET domain-containing protein-lysine N-methyltransferase [Candidatus Woesearchaeota archaeon CG10_big_fil_rev_8_21_14_0_10_45_16]